jgi:hypothetical protein
MTNTHVLTHEVDVAGAIADSRRMPRLADEEVPGASSRDHLLATLTAYQDKLAQLEQALLTNRRIGIAIGILMTRHGRTDQQAFDTLRTLSQHRNRKVRDLAEDVIYTGTLPT